VITFPRRAIEEVPALIIAALEAAGRMPKLSEHVERMGNVPGRRPPTLQEVAALRWLCLWEGPVRFERGTGEPLQPQGVLAFRDVFDYHTSSDVREVIHLVGTGRAVYELIDFARSDAKASGRRIIGAVDLANGLMRQALGRKMLTRTRQVYEDLT